MIPYEAFKALPIAERDAICAEKMGWIRDATRPYMWDKRDGTRVDMSAWSPTTDRNGAAMMVEKVCSLGEDAKDAFGVAWEQTAPLDFENGNWVADILLIDPCLIAYCAYVALEEA